MRGNVPALLAGAFFLVYAARLQASDAAEASPTPDGGDFEQQYAVTEAQIHTDLDQNNSDDAWKLASELVSDHPDHWESYFSAAEVMETEGKHADSLEYLNKALENAPEEKKADLTSLQTSIQGEVKSDGLVESAKKKQSSGDLAGSADDFLQAAKEQPDNLDLSTSAAQALVQAKRYDDAIQVLRGIRGKAADPSQVDASIKEIAEIKRQQDAPAPKDESDANDNPAPKKHKHRSDGDDSEGGSSMAADFLKAIDH